MVTFKIINADPEAVSWLIDLETINGPIFPLQTGELDAPFILDVSNGLAVSAYFVTYRDPVGTAYNATTSWVATNIKAITIEDGKTYIMDMATGNLVNGGSNKASLIMLGIVAGLTLFAIIKKK
jgi:hypothetical protein